MKRARGMLTINQLYARCVVEADTGCWLWQGATTNGGKEARIWTFDHARGEKRSMSGPLAAWNIAFKAAPKTGHLVYRCCQRKLCLAPAHLRQASDLAEIGAFIRRCGSRKGTALEARRANIALAHIANGLTPTPAAIVQAIRARGDVPTNVALAAEFGLAHSTVSRIRRGDSHRQVVAA